MQRTAMMSQLEEQNKALKESADIPDLKRLSKQTTQSIMRQYVQNLYRFFRLFPSAQEFDNPFEYLVDFPEVENPLRPLILEPECLFRLIGLNIKQKQYLRATDFFFLLELYHPERMEVTQLQQLGLCYQKMEMYSEAVSVYTRADLLKPNSYWTILHLAQCHRELEEHEKALEYYKIAEAMKPDNLNLTFHVAEQLYEAGEYEEALPLLHKLLYLHPESLRTLRLLAECCFFNRQSAQAAKHYERMMAEHAADMTSLDWKLAAYNSWLLGKRDDCFRLLSRAEELHAASGEAPMSFADTISNASGLLESLGASNDELTYLCDAYYRSKRR